MATELVNKHITRVLAAGGTVADSTRLADLDAWITSEGLYGYLGDWSNPAFGVIKNGSNEISKVMGLGTTWLPRLGDLTPSSPANTLYDATGVGGVPAWNNTSSSAYHYYGAARAGTIRTQQIRRKHHDGLTIIGCYRKTHSNAASLIGLGQFGGICLQNTSGSPGNCKAWIGPAAFTATHATTVANNAINIIGLTFDGDTLTTYVEGVAGAQATDYVSTYSNSSKAQYRPLLGAANLNDSVYHMLVHGSSESHYGLSGTAVTIDGIVNNAQMYVSDLAFFYTALTPTQMASANALIRGWVGS